MYGYNNNFGGYVPPIQQRPMYMPTQPQVQDMEQMTPFQIVRFVNEKEAQAFTLLPNQKALLMDTANMKFWIKWTDSLGNSTTETYKFEKTDNGFKVRLESEETAKIPVGDYIYEVEYIFADGTVNTPNQSAFSIMDQIIM